MTKKGQMQILCLDCVWCWFMIGRIRLSLLCIFIPRFNFNITTLVKKLNTPRSCLSLLHRNMCFASVRLALAPNDPANCFFLSCLDQILTRISQISFVYPYLPSLSSLLIRVLRSNMIHSFTSLTPPRSLSDFKDSYHFYRWTRRDFAFSLFFYIFFHFPNFRFEVELNNDLSSTATMFSGHPILDVSLLFIFLLIN